MWTKEKCRQLDISDKLAGYKDQFHLPKGIIYLDGNSLGALPKTALARSQQVIQDEWGNDLVKSWNSAGWFDMPVKLGNKLAKILGANPGEMVITDSISTNVFKTVSAALMLQKEKYPNRKVIVAERDSFPSDLYMMQGMLNLLDNGYELRLFDDDLSLEDALSEDVAVLEISEINYRTGYLQDMKKVTELAHAKGILTVWDLAHSAGAINVNLNKANADFAVGCTYKFLNAGPGAPGFVWAASRHLGKFWQPLSGWWGHEQPFLMDQQYRQAADGRHLLCGTPPIVSLALVECGLDIFLTVDMDEVRKKSLALSDLFIDLIAERCGDYNFNARFF